MVQQGNKYENEELITCTKCKKLFSQENIYSKNDNDSFDMFDNQDNFGAICISCQRKNARKRLIILSIITMLVILIGITIVILRLGGIWLW